ncbi:alpha/beta hydrolase [Actinoplanes sp. CA-051413]|uniref:alpha/beta hydrolase n=1 Tax=Actinoplanes sp. CA-051413 TaxID=3239899 RepID=UPI003D9932EA
MFGSLATGLIAVLLLVAAPFVPAEEAAVTGAVLCGFAFGWTTLAVLSARLTDQPQIWAAVPAAFMGLGGLLLLVFGSSVDRVLSWVWPAAVLVLVVWMVVQARRHLRSRSRRWLLYPVIGMLTVAAVGGAYETVSAATDTPPAMLGQSIDVGGHSLYLHCTGTGSPTVVLQPGLGAMSSDMGWIAPRVAVDSRVCVYDRPGRGGSDAVSTPEDASRIAGDLHTLLQRGNVPGPYVLVGHSFGGLYVLTYAARYPDEVAGMVLVDTTAPRDTTAASGSADPNRYYPMGRAATLLSTSARLGLTRLFAPAEGGTLPPQSEDEAQATLVTGSNLRSFVDEFAQANASAVEAGAFTDFGAKPLVVLTAGTGSDADLVAGHVRLAAMSTNSAHRVIKGASHQELLADEKDSAATSQGALDVVAAIRHATPLAQ